MKLLGILSILVLMGCNPSKKIVIQEEAPQKESNGILSFNHLINQADFAILDSNPALAVQLYRQAFAQRQVEYIAPYYNAYLAAKAIGDCEMSYFAAKQLLKYGAWLTHFQPDPCLGDDDYLWTELEDVYMTSAENTELSQAFRSLSYALLVRGNNSASKIFNLLNSSEFKERADSLMYEKMDSLPAIDFSQIPVLKVDSSEMDSLATVFIELVERNGFPSEQNVGAEWSEAGITYLHYFSFSPIYERNKKVRSIFDDAFEEGLISAGEYAGVSLAQQVYINPVFWMKGTNESYVFDFSTKELQKINSIRQGIGLPSIERQIEVRRKIQEVPDNNYFFSWLGKLHYYIDSPPRRAYHLLD